MAYSGRGLFALQKGQALVGSHVLEAEKEQVVVFENRAKPKGRFASAVRARVCVSPVPFSLAFLCVPSLLCIWSRQPAQSAERNHWEGNLADWR